MGKKNKSPESKSAAAAETPSVTPLKMSGLKVDTPSSHKLDHVDDSIPSTPSEASPNPGGSQRFPQELSGKLESVKSGEVAEHGHYSHLRPNTQESGLPSLEAATLGGGSEAHITAAEELSEKQLLRKVSDMQPGEVAVVSVGPDGTRTISSVTPADPVEGASGHKKSESPVSGLLNDGPQAAGKGRNTTGRSNFPGFRQTPPPKSPPRRAASLIDSVPRSQVKRLFWWVAVPLSVFLLCLLLRQHSDHLVQQSRWANSPRLARLLSRSPSIDAWTNWGSEKAASVLPSWAYEPPHRSPLQKVKDAVGSFLGRASGVLPDRRDITGYQTGSGLEGASQHLEHAVGRSGRSPSGTFNQVKQRLTGWLPNAEETKDSVEASAAKAKRSARQTLPDVTEGGRVHKTADHATSKLSEGIHAAQDHIPGFSEPSAAQKTKSWTGSALRTAQALLPTRSDISGYRTGSGAEVSQGQSEESVAPGVPTHTAGTAGDEWVDAARQGVNQAADAAASGLGDAADAGSAAGEGLLARVKNVLTGAQQSAKHVASRQEADAEKLASDVSGMTKREAVRAKEAAAASAQHQSSRVANGVRGAKNFITSQAAHLKEAAVRGSQDATKHAKSQASQAAGHVEGIQQQTVGAVKKQAAHAQDVVTDSATAASDATRAAAGTAQRKANNAAAFAKGAGHELSETVQEEAANARDTAAETAQSGIENAKGAVGLLQQQIGSLASKALDLLQWPYRSARRNALKARGFADEKLTAAGEAVSEQGHMAADSIKGAGSAVKTQAVHAEEAVVGNAKATLNTAQRKANYAAAFTKGAGQEMADIAREETAHAGEVIADKAHAAADTTRAGAAAAKHKAGDVATKVKGAGQDLSASAQQAAAHAEKKAGDAAARVKGASQDLSASAQQAAARANKKASDAAAKVKRAGQDLSASAQQAAAQAKDTVTDTTNAAMDGSRAAVGTAQRKANNAAAYAKGAGVELSETVQEEAANARDAATETAQSGIQNAKAAGGLLQQQASSLIHKAAGAVQWPFKAAWRQATHAEHVVSDSAHAAAGNLKRQASHAEHVVSDSAHAAVGGLRRKAGNAAAFTQGAGHELGDTLAEEAVNAQEAVADGTHAAQRRVWGLAGKVQGMFRRTFGVVKGAEESLVGTLLRTLGLQRQHHPLHLSRSAVVTGLGGLAGLGALAAFMLLVGSWLTKESQGTAHEEEEEEVDEGAEEDVPTPVRRSRRQASQVSQGTSLAATDLPAVSTGRALSALQAASALQTAAAQPAASAQPSMSHPVSRIQSHTVSTVASPTVSGARYPLRSQHEVSGSMLHDSDVDSADEAGTRVRRSARKRTTRTMVELTETTETQ